MPRPIRRRAFLAGAGGATAAAAITAIGVRSGRIPARSIWNDVTGACGEPGATPPDPGWPVVEATLRSSTVDGPVGYAFVRPPGVPRRGAAVAELLPGRSGSARDTIASSCFPGFLAEGIAAAVAPFALASSTAAPRIGTSARAA